MVTIKQIAERAGVSTATVSNVIHGKTKRVSPANVEKIQRLITEMGYVQRMGLRVLRNDRSNLIAVVINSHKEYEESVLSDPFYGRVVGFIEERLQKHGYYMLFYASQNIDDIFRMVMAWDVDGVIALTFPRSDCEKLYSMVQKPVVSIDAYGEVEESRQVPNIGLDERSGGYQMVRHLIELGYEDIFVCATQDLGNDHQRWVGAQMAAAEAGSNVRLQLRSIGVSQELRMGYYQRLSAMLPFRRKTALFFLSDYMALEANSYLASQGIRVPEQVGITGYDDILFAAKFSVPLMTTIRQDMQQKAHLSVDRLISLVQDPDLVLDDAILPVSLVVRRSAM